MSRLLPAMLLLACLLLPGLSLAVIETYEFENDDLYERYKLLSEELRCPKCQNQNIAASDAPISQDLRRELHEQLHEGKSDGEIMDFMVQRYGEFVLYRPRWSSATALLWLAPAILLAIGGWILFGLLRRGQQSTTTAAVSSEKPTEQAAHLSADDENRLKALLGDSEETRD